MPTECRPLRITTPYCRVKALIITSLLCHATNFCAAAQQYIMPQSLYFAAFLDLLPKYTAIYTLWGYLAGQDKLRHNTPIGVLCRSEVEAGLPRAGSCHTLRHCFATHLKSYWAIRMLAPP